MSNLKLPAISNFADALKAWANTARNGEFAYKTTIERWWEGEDDYVTIRHHGRAIIEYYEDGRVNISNAGWHSRTTSNRLHRLTPDNVRVYIRGGLMWADILEADGETTTHPVGSDWLPVGALAPMAVAA